MTVHMPRRCLRVCLSNVLVTSPLGLRGDACLMPLSSWTVQVGTRNAQWF